MKKTTVIICTLLFIMPILAHEFWLQPQKFIFKKGEKATIKFLVGEDFTGDNWAGNSSRIKTLIFYNGTSATDISGSLSSNKGDSIQLNLPGEGTMMVAY